MVLGLDEDVEPEEIEDEVQIKTKNLVHRIVTLKARRPIYMVVTDKLMTLNKLQRQAPVINYTRVQWKRYENNRLLVQCRNCQGWGHATSNCHASVSSALGHMQVKTNTPTLQSAPIVEAGIPHANINCPVYQAIKQNIETRLNQTRYNTKTTSGNQGCKPERNNPEMLNRKAPSHPKDHTYWCDREPRWCQDGSLLEQMKSEQKRKAEKLWIKPNDPAEGDLTRTSQRRWTGRNWEAGEEAGPHDGTKGKTRQPDHPE